MKGTILLTLGIMLVASCAPKQALDKPPLQYSFMPKYLELDSIQPLADQDTSAVVDSTYEDFKSIAVGPGTLVTEDGDTMEIPGGILISERKAALSLYYEAAWPRHVRELRYREYLMKSYYDKALAAESLYQQEIARLHLKSRRTWLERNAAYIGFGAALLTMILRDYALGQLLGD